MRKVSRWLAVGVVLGALVAVCFTAFGDETSTGDKLRILYSNRFTFTDDGLPLVTIEITSGQSEVRLASESGMLVLPDGDGGAVIDAGTDWTVTIERAAPAEVLEWTAVARLGPEDEVGVQRALKSWRKRGYKPQRFEIGTIFGVEGEVIDSREVLVGIDPVAAPRGGKRARALGRKHGVITSVHPEMVKRPAGTIVATSGETVIRNPSVIWFRPRRANGTIEVPNIEAGRGGSQLRTKRETRRYFGSVYVTLGKDGKLAAVNAVSEDKLLAGLVPAEIFPSAPDGALRAQAVAARTELLQKIGTRHLTDPYLLCSSQHCQVYAGAGHEHPRTSRAVKHTRGEVLFRDGGGIVDARYSASCGGHSEHNDNIWGGHADPSLRGHLDSPRANKKASRFAGGITEANLDAFLALPGKAAYCGSTRFAKNRYRWTKTVAAADLDRRVAEHYPKVGSVRGFEPLARGVSGRINRLRIHGSKKSVVVTGDVHIRRMLGGLRSTLFKVTTKGDRNAPTAFEFRGAGFGHGVGMCQTGAIGMAKAGRNYGAILHHYYPGSHVQRLY